MDGEVSLARYRAASREVVEAIKPLAKVVERASIDEVYVDVSDVARVIAMDAEIEAEVAATRTSGGATADASELGLLKNGAKMLTKSSSARKVTN